MVRDVDLIEFTTARIADFISTRKGCNPSIDIEWCPSTVATMKGLNISLPAAMEDYVRTRCERDYGNVSEFFREMVRERMAVEIEADLKFLNSTRVGAEPGPTEQEIEEILALQKRVRKELHARGV
jgi:Arc/MetJ-type ribon-helix-helix transcriptional regulator